MAPVSEPDHRPPAATAAATDETLKETFESIVIAFILAFIFRAYVVEAFIIPTGSMAPTLLGRHFEVRCEQCGYGFSIDHGPHGAATDRPMAVDCPMCRFPQPLTAGTASRSGDRLLVQKYLYELFEPRRWDVVVFRNPQASNADGSPGPRTNYIKRLVGLPGEELQLIDGNVFVKPLDQPNADWRIARKVDPEANPHWERVQRAVWQPIYHSQYVPRDHGRAVLSKLTNGWDIEGRQRSWAVPWKPAEAVDPVEGEGDEGGAEAVATGRWERGDLQQGWRRSYRLVPAAAGPSPPEAHEVMGELTFDWSDYYPRGTAYTYNSLAQRRSDGVVRGQPIEDVRLAATLVPEGAAAQLELEVTTRLDADVAKVVAQLRADGRVMLLRREASDASRETIIAAVDTGHPTAPGLGQRLELWVVDQALLVFLDGEVVLRKEYDLPMGTIRSRPPPHDRPRVAIRVRGSGATLHGVELDRDLAYTPQLGDGTPAVRGAPFRSATGQLNDPPPITIRPGRYFVLGDNSPISSDGRFWNQVEPWIQRNMFDELTTAPTPGAGQPSTTSRPEPDADEGDESEEAFKDLLVSDTQVVPRGLMVGRAFFIYFPAPHAVAERGRQILPNFGEMRFVY